MTESISREELSAYLDGEVTPARSVAIRQAIAGNQELAERFAALRRDKMLLCSVLRRVADAPVPQEWLDRIDSAVAQEQMEPPSGRSAIIPFPRRRRHVLTLASIAAAVLLLLSGFSAWRWFAPGPDAILQQAESAAAGTVAPSSRIGAAALPGPDAQRAILARATGLPIRTPDLTRLGWRLTSLETFQDAAQLRYANGSGKKMTVYVRKSLGAPRFDLLKTGQTRICVWQDDVVGAVILADLSAGEMMRVAGAAYADLNL